MAPSTWNLPLPGFAYSYLSLMPATVGPLWLANPEPVMPFRFAWDLKNTWVQGWTKQERDVRYITFIFVALMQCLVLNRQARVLGNLIHFCNVQRSSYTWPCSRAPSGNVSRGLKTQRQRLQCRNWFYSSYPAPRTTPIARSPGPPPLLRWMAQRHWALPRDAQKPSEGGSGCTRREGLSLLFVK